MIVAPLGAGTALDGQQRVPVIQNPTLRVMLIQIFLRFPSEADRFYSKLI